MTTAASKFQPRKVSRLGRLADRKNDRKRAQYQTAAERKYKQQPNREVSQFDYAFAHNVTGTDQVSHATSNQRQANENCGTQPSGLGSRHGQARHDMGSEAVVINVRHTFTQLPI